MKMISEKRWTENNQKYLVASIDEIKSLLKKYIEDRVGKGEAVIVDDNINRPLLRKKYRGNSLPALENICNLFDLSTFEKSLLVLCAGIELDSELAELCAKAQGNPNSTYPTFGLALAFLPNAHWSALTPASPLRYFRLIDLQYFPQTLITSSPLHIEERILHYLVGISYLEKGLQGMLKAVRVQIPFIVASHKLLTERILLAWSSNSNNENIMKKQKNKKKKENNNNKEKFPCIKLWGTDKTSKMNIAKWACNEIGLDLWHIPGELIPTKPEEMQSFIQLWTRESALLGSGLYISAEDVVEPAVQNSIRQLVVEEEQHQVPRPLFLGTNEPWSILKDPTITIEVKKPLKEEQCQIWKSCLGEGEYSFYYNNEFSSEISKLVSQFDLNAYAIQAAAMEALLSMKCDGASLPSAIWKSSRAAARPRMAGLAQQIIPKARLNDLVLPAREKHLLDDIAVQVKQKDKVYEEWGFEKISGRGLAITALFVGKSGTGKTLAAEVLANELNLDLFHIDLSMIVSKYIGETEKNLRQVFDAAEDSGSILFFDEADALFGKRSEVRDSHDRYANIEIGYLLQRMEAYRGLAILATNMKDALDPAFLRRIRFIINFPFPDENSRAEIWQHIFPPSTPTNGLDIHRLARLDITGGNIRNIALNASFLAADQGVSVNMEHIKQAVYIEYEKLEHPLPRAETADW